MPLPADVRSELLDLIDRHFGIRESEYGNTHIDDAVANVLPTTPYTSARELVDALSYDRHPAWLDAIVEYLTVGETYFFRDPAQVAAMRQVILPSLVKSRAADRRLRVWSAGCSTGEEPYTFAMLMRELPALANWQILLVGTDVNRESLRVAREARYPSWSFRATPDPLRQHFFEPAGNRWRVVDAVRSMVRFAWSNLAADPLLPPSADFDVIACRNVTIYFDEAATQRLYRSLVQALAPGGWLVLGPSDPLPVERELLERIEVENAVLWRRRAAVSPIKQRPQTPAARVPRPVLRPKTTPTAARDVQPAEAELEAGLLALESGSAHSALEWLRRATFRNPHSPLGQFALARAYFGVGDFARAQAALLHSRRLLEPLDAQVQVPGSDDMSVETLRQAVQTALEEAA